MTNYDHEYKKEIISSEEETEEEAKQKRRDLRNEARAIIEDADEWVLVAWVKSTNKMPQSVYVKLAATAIGETLIRHGRDFMVQGYNNLVKAFKEINEELKGKE